MLNEERLHVGIEGSYEKLSLFFLLLDAHV